MAEITAAEVAKLRKLSGAGMMDCKKALVEADGNIDKAMELIRQRGLAIANKRSDREASEGIVIAQVSADHRTGYMLALHCETDFVARNETFKTFVQTLFDLVVKNDIKDLNTLKATMIDGKTVETLVMENSGVTGEKFELGFCGKIEAESVVAYIHQGSKLGTLVGFNQGNVDAQVAKEIAMQVAAMNPVSIDISDVAPEVVEQELRIGREQARLEGKAEAMLERIAQGKLQKFYKESTLLNQEFIMDSKLTVKDYLTKISKDLTVISFLRHSLKN